LSKKERAAAVRAKRKHDPDPERKGAPINVSNFGKGKISELYSSLDSDAMNLLFNEVDKINEENENVSVTDQFTENKIERRKDFGSFAVEGPCKMGLQYSSARKNRECGSGKNRSILTEGVAELTTSSEYARGGIEASPTITYGLAAGAEPTTTQKTGSTKITLEKIRAKQKEIAKESIDKGIEPGLSMATGGENTTRPAPKNKLIKKPLEEMQGDETTASIGDKKEDELKKQGIDLKSFKAKRLI
jgi:hypothetical protein